MQRTPIPVTLLLRLDSTFFAVPRRGLTPAAGRPCRRPCRAGPVTGPIIHQFLHLGRCGKAQSIGARGRRSPQSCTVWRLPMASSQTAAGRHPEHLGSVKRLMRNLNFDDLRFCYASIQSHQHRCVVVGHDAAINDRRRQGDCSSPVHGPTEAPAELHSFTRYVGGRRYGDGSKIRQRLDPSIPLLRITTVLHNQHK